MALAGCAAGPDFRRPAAPETTQVTPAPLPAATVAAPVTAGAAQRFVPGAAVRSDWWALFQNPALDRLISEALAQSPTLAASQAALRAAEENRRVQRAALFPSADANLQVNRSKISGATFGSPGSFFFTLYNASVNVSYSFDFFGMARRGLEASQAQIDYQRFLLEGSQLTLTSNLVTTAVQQASLKARISATAEIVAAHEELLRLTARKVELGGGSRVDLLAQQAQLAQFRANLPPLEKELAQSRHQMAVLAGRLPSQADTLPEFDLADLKLPGELPVSLPSDLVRQRPDIRAAEELLHQASAEVGVATANLYPKITLTGSLGSTTTSLGSLFGAGTSVWGLGAGLLQPIFHGGELMARRDAAKALYQQSEAQYRGTVLSAFQNVADVLRALELDARTLQAQAEAERAAHESLELSRKAYQLGATNYLALLDAQRQYLQSRIALVQTQAQRLADTAALYQALGGGWWNRAPQPELPKQAQK